MKTAIALTLALTASAASAEGAWTLADTHDGIFALSVDRTAMIIVTCTGVMSLIRHDPAAGLDFQIDGNRYYSVKADPVRLTLPVTMPAAFGHYVEISGDLLWELMDGMKLMVNWSDDDFDRFSLIGFTETMKTLDCIPVNETRL